MKRLMLCLELFYALYTYSAFLLLSVVRSMIFSVYSIRNTGQVSRLKVSSGPPQRNKMQDPLPSLDT